MDTTPPNNNESGEREMERRVCYVRVMRELEKRARLQMQRRQSALAKLRWTVMLVLVLAATAGADRRDRRGESTDAHDDRGDGIDVVVDVEPDATAGPSRTIVRVPAIADVLEAAYDAAGLARDPTTSWRRRARVAGLIPWVTVRTGWDQNWRDEDPDVGRSRTFEVRATWRLDRLLFDGRELQMSTIDAARRRERRRLASRVIRTYFSWRKLVGAAGGDPRVSLAAEAAAAELDALTDGWFSERTKSAR